MKLEVQNIQKQHHLSIEQLQPRYFNQTKQTDNQTKQVEVSFQELFKRKTMEESAPIQELRFSKHAAGRLTDRGIALSDSQMERLNNGVKRAQQKGIRDSLVIVDDLAFIVNIPNNTVVTAMDSTQANDNVFTNINGAVIM